MALSPAGFNLRRVRRTVGDVDKENFCGDASPVLARRKSAGRRNLGLSDLQSPPPAQLDTQNKELDNVAAGDIETTPVPQEKVRKRKLSQNRRVSFAEKLSCVHEYPRDDEYKTPPKETLALGIDAEELANVIGKPALHDSPILAPEPGEQKVVEGESKMKGFPHGDDSDMKGKREFEELIQSLEQRRFNSPASSEEGENLEKSGPVDMRSFFLLQDGCDFLTEDDTLKLDVTVTSHGEISGQVPNLPDLSVPERQSNSGFLQANHYAYAFPGSVGGQDTRMLEDSPTTSEHSDIFKFSPRISSASIALRFDTTADLGTDRIERSIFKSSPKKGSENHIDANVDRGEGSITASILDLESLLAVDAPQAETEAVRSNVMEQVMEDNADSRMQAAENVDSEKPNLDTAENPAAVNFAAFRFDDIQADTVLYQSNGNITDSVPALQTLLDMDAFQSANELDEPLTQEQGSDSCTKSFEATAMVNPVSSSVGFSLEDPIPSLLENKSGGREDGSITAAMPGLQSLIEMDDISSGTIGILEPQAHEMVTAAKANLQVQGTLGSTEGTAVNEQLPSEMPSDSQKEMEKLDTINRMDTVTEKPASIATNAFLSVEMKTFPEVENPETATTNEEEQFPSSITTSPCETNAVLSPAAEGERKFLEPTDKISEPQAAGETVLQEEHLEEATSHFGQLKNILSIQKTKIDVIRTGEKDSHIVTKLSYVEVESVYPSEDMAQPQAENKFPKSPYKMREEEDLAASQQDSKRKEESEPLHFWATQGQQLVKDRERTCQDLSVRMKDVQQTREDGEKLLKEISEHTNLLSQLLLSNRTLLRQKKEEQIQKQLLHEQNSEKEVEEAKARVRRKRLEVQLLKELLEKSKHDAESDKQALLEEECKLKQLRNKIFPMPRFGRACSSVDERGSQARMLESLLSLQSWTISPSLPLHMSSDSYELVLTFEGCVDLRFRKAQGGPPMIVNMEVNSDALEKAYPDMEAGLVFTDGLSLAGFKAPSLSIPHAVQEAGQRIERAIELLKQLKKCRSTFPHLALVKLIPPKTETGIDVQLTFIDSSKHLKITFAISLSPPSMADSCFGEMKLKSVVKSGRPTKEFELDVKDFKKLEIAPGLFRMERFCEAVEAQISFF